MTLSSLVSRGLVLTVVVAEGDTLPWDWEVTRNWYSTPGCSPSTVTPRASPASSWLCSSTSPS